MSVKVDTRHDGELKHYFRHSDFGARSPVLEILCGTHSLDVTPPQWPAGAVHSTMVRVSDRLLLAEGIMLQGHALPPEKAYQGRYAGWTREWLMRDLPPTPDGKPQRYLAPSDHQDAMGEAGAYLVLWAYYGIYGVQRGLAEGTGLDNLKFTKECEDPEVAVYPLTGHPMPVGRVEAARPGEHDRKFHSRIEIIEELRRMKGSPAKAMREEAIGMIRRAHRAYDAAAQLHEQLTNFETLYA